MPCVTFNVAFRASTCLARNAEVEKGAIVLYTEPVLSLLFLEFHHLLNATIPCPLLFGKILLADGAPFVCHSVKAGSA